LRHPIAALGPRLAARRASTSAPWASATPWAPCAERLGRGAWGLAAAASRRRGALGEGLALGAWGLASRRLAPRLLGRGLGASRRLGPRAPWGALYRPRRHDRRARRGRRL